MVVAAWHLLMRNPTKFWAYSSSYARKGESDETSSYEQLLACMMERRKDQIGAGEFKTKAFWKRLH
jgi:hypothetical protein